MISYIAKRIASILPSLFAVLTALFFVLRVVPGGPFDADRKLPPEVERSLRDYYDLSAPVYIQYKNWLVRLIVHQDLGPTFRYGGRSVNEIIRLSLPYSAQLGFFAALLALGIGIPLGVYAATKHNTVKDHAAMAVAMTGVSIPRFVLAPLLILIFSLKLYIFPVARWETWRHMVLPVICAGLPLAAYIARLSRTGML
ncbi:MAG: ABC transporter permease subunit, partial [Alphaproteobacteria bacterium]|nr:ABC transporter permease subunit [Alphaproteobacteria bacterium]